MIHHQTEIFGACSGSALFAAAVNFAEHGPTLGSFASLVAAVAALVGAVSSYRNGAQQRRHAEEEHQLKMRQLAAGLGVNPLEQLEPRSN